jgi:lipoprotein Spr
VPENTWRVEANKWIGTPYRFGGQDRSGIDCSGFAGQLYRSVAGVTLPRSTKDQFQVGIPVKDTQLRAGDLIFFQTTQDPISHVGVWLGNNQFAHASTSRGVIFSTLREGYYSKRFRGARRVLR